MSMQGKEKSGIHRYDSLRFTAQCQLVKRGDRLRAADYREKAAAGCVIGRPQMA